MCAVRAARLGAASAAGGNTRCDSCVRSYVSRSSQTFQQHSSQRVQNILPRPLHHPEHDSPASRTRHIHRRLGWQGQGRCVCTIAPLERHIRIIYRWRYESHEDHKILQEKRAAKFVGGSAYHALYACRGCVQKNMKVTVQSATPPPLLLVPPCSPGKVSLDLEQAGERRGSRPVGVGLLVLAVEVVRVPRDDLGENHGSLLKQHLHTQHKEETPHNVAAAAAPGKQNRGMVGSTLRYG